MCMIYHKQCKNWITKVRKCSRNKILHAIKRNPVPFIKIFYTFCGMPEAWECKEVTYGYIC